MYYYYTLLVQRTITTGVYLFQGNLVKRVHGVLDTLSDHAQLVGTNSNLRETDSV